MRLSFLSLILLQLLGAPWASLAASSPIQTCETTLSPKPRKAPAVNDEQAWKISQKSLAALKRKIVGQDHTTDVVLAGALAEQFTWLNGGPGGAKTMVARAVFESLLETVPETEKRIFLIQFHKLISESKITGTVKIKSLLEKGKYEIETSQSLVGDRFLFMIADEAEKANPATLNALLSVLNERAAFHGSRVVKAILAAGVFTSNKSISSFLDGFGTDRSAGEALLDRMGMKVHVLNQQLTNSDREALYYAIYGEPDKSETPLYFSQLKKIMKLIEVPDSLVQDIGKIIWNFDVYVTAKIRDSDIAFRQGSRPQEYFPPNQFSNRSVTKIANLLVAAYVVKQLSSGIELKDLRKVLNRSDLPLLSWTSTYNLSGPLEYDLLDISDYQSGVVNAKKGVPVISQMIAANLPAEWNPYSNELTIYALGRVREVGRIRLKRLANGQLQVDTKAVSEYQIAPSESESVIAYIQEAEEKAKVDLSNPTYRPSPKISMALAKGTLPSKTRSEIKDILEDQQAFANALNTQLASEPGADAPIKAKSRKVKKSSAQKLSTQEAYELSVQAVKEINEDFHEMDYAVEALVTATLSGKHVYLFGPPGGAKTALAQAVLKRVLKSMKRDQARSILKALLPKLKKNESFLIQVLTQIRSEDRKSFDIFMLQFHKLLPEGIISGFPKLQKMLDTGVEEIDFSTSLAAQKFIFAILDETDKANPQILQQLLSILNERMVFNGNDPVSVGLRTAVLTSNKMTSEMLESFVEDDGDPILDRVGGKVFVMNKMSSVEATIDLMRSFLPGVKQSKQMTEMPLHLLDDLVNRVQLSEDIITILTSVHEKYLAKRLTEQEESQRRSQVAKKEYPDYYTMASIGSDRSYPSLLKQMQSRLIANQIARGVPFNQLKFEFDLDQLPLFFEGLGYWTPGEIEKFYDQSGVLQFKVQRNTVEQWLKTARVSRRVGYFLEQSLAEAQDYVNIVNLEIQEFIVSNRQVLGQYEHLFPELFKDNAVRSRELIQPAAQPSVSP